MQESTIRKLGAGALLAAYAALGVLLLVFERASGSTWGPSGPFTRGFLALSVAFPAGGLPSLLRGRFPQAFLAASVLWWLLALIDAWADVLPFNIVHIEGFCVLLPITVSILSVVLLFSHRAHAG